MRPVKTGKGVRMTFSRQKEVLEMPNLIEIQKNSYQWFLDEGLKEVVAQAAELEGAGQKAPYVQGDVNLHDKDEVEAADRKRFAFVNAIVKEVENRKVLTKDKTIGDKIDSVITHPVIGIAIFAVVMYLVFYISQSTLGTYLADILTGWIEQFQGWATDSLEKANASAFLVSLLCDNLHTTL